MDCNFVCLWRRLNCNWSLPFCADLLIYEIIIGFLNNSNLHAIISTLLIINLHWVKKIYFVVLEEILTMLVISFNRSQSFNYTHYLFYKKRFKSEINSFCIRTPVSRPFFIWTVCHRLFCICHEISGELHVEGTV